MGDPLLPPGRSGEAPLQGRQRGVRGPCGPCLPPLSPWLFLGNQPVKLFIFVSERLGIVFVTSSPCLFSSAVTLFSNVFHFFNSILSFSNGFGFLLHVLFNFQTFFRFLKLCSKCLIFEWFRFSTTPTLSLCFFCGHLQSRFRCFRMFFL